MFKSLLGGTEWKCLELPAGKQRSSSLLNPRLSLVQWPGIVHGAKGKFIFISEHINTSLVNVYLNMSISLQKIFNKFDHSVQSLSRVWLFATPWTEARQASLSITNSQSLLKLMSIESVMPSSHLILCRPLLLLPLIFPSIRVFSKESVLHIRWPKDWSFSFSISPSNEYSGLISFRIDQLDLLAVQGTLKSLLNTPQFKSINYSELSFLYGPTLTSIPDYWKNHSFD